MLRESNVIRTYMGVPEDSKVTKGLITRFQTLSRLESKPLLLVEYCEGRYAGIDDFLQPWLRR